MKFNIDANIANALVYSEQFVRKYNTDEQNIEQLMIDIEDSIINRATRGLESTAVDAKGYKEADIRECLIKLREAYFVAYLYDEYTIKVEW